MEDTTTFSLHEDAWIVIGKYNRLLDIRVTKLDEVIQLLTSALIVESPIHIDPASPLSDDGFEWISELLTDPAYLNVVSWGDIKADHAIVTREWILARNRATDSVGWSGLQIYMDDSPQRNYPIRMIGRSDGDTEISFPMEPESCLIDFLESKPSVVPVVGNRYAFMIVTVINSAHIQIAYSNCSHTLVDVKDGAVTFDLNDFIQVHELVCTNTGNYFRKLFIFESTKESNAFRANLMVKFNQHPMSETIVDMNIMKKRENIMGAMIEGAVFGLLPDQECFLFNFSKKIGDMDGRTIRKVSINGKIFYLAISKDDNKIDAIVILQDNYILRSIKCNVNDGRNLVANLMNFIMNKAGVDIRVTSKQSVTNDGFRWIAYLSKNDPSLYVTINGKQVNEDVIWANWKDGYSRSEIKISRNDSNIHEQTINTSMKKSNYNRPDTIRMDVPLLIRMMEFAREDAKTDMDLHDVAEQAIKLCANGDSLGMAQYNELISTSSNPRSVTEAKLEFLTVDTDSVAEMHQYLQRHAKAYSDFTGGTYSPAVGKYGIRELRESADNDVDSFIERFMDHDYKKTIRVGEEFCVLMLEVLYGIKTFGFNLYTPSKVVKDIIMQGDKIKYIEFEDGTKFPRITPVTFKGKNVQLYNYFSTVEDAEHTLMTSIMAVPDGWDYEVSKGDVPKIGDLNESSIDTTGEVDEGQVIGYQSIPDWKFGQPLSSNMLGKVKVVKIVNGVVHVKTPDGRVFQVSPKSLKDDEKVTTESVMAEFEKFKNGGY